MQYKFNMDEIKIELEDGYYNVTIDDQTETYKSLVAFGKSLDSASSDEEAFDAALKYVIKKYSEQNKEPTE